jgi:20S proteasome subunit alpha 6
MMNNRGGTGRGRGGNMYSGGRGGSQTGNQLKSHGSRGNFGGGRDYGNRDHGNRRGGSFVGSGGHHQGAGGTSFRGRGQGHTYSHFSRGGRHDGGGGSFGSREGLMASSSFLASSSGSGKKDENRRNFTDFKIVGLEISDLSWTWGTIRTSGCQIKTEPVPEVLSSSPSICSGDTVGQADSLPTKEESTDLPTSFVKAQEGEPTSDLKASSTAPDDHAVPQGTPALLEMPAPAAIPPPPSRMRIYFNSPVTPDDSRPIPSGTSFSIVGSDEAGSRRGKRKKSEDDDGDLEEGRAPPPPPGGSRPERSMSIDRFERASTAASAEPSVAETASEGDWLMAAIGEDEGDGEDDGGEPPLSGNDLNSRDGSTYVAEGEYGEFESSPSTVGVCVGVGSGALGWPSAPCRTPVSTGIPAASACSHVTDLGYVVKVVSMMVSLPRLMTARASVIWQMSPPASWMDRRWVVFARHLLLLRLTPHKLWTFPRLRTRGRRSTRAVALMWPWLNS